MLNLFDNLINFIKNILFLDITFFINIITIAGTLIFIAFYTLSERKVMASIQRRKGPDTVGFIGILQPIADGIKLLLKEHIIPRKSNTVELLYLSIALML